jgi:hypothetical protein
MRQRFCEQEPRVLEAATSGRWEPGLRQHLEQCPACAEVALVASFMKEAEADPAEARLPDAELVWWKAQLKARRAATEKATRPIAMAEKAACAGGGLALIAVLAFLWPSVQSWGDWMFSNWMEGSRVAPVLAVGLASMFAAGVVSVLFAVGVGLYFAWSDR